MVDFRLNEEQEMMRKNVRRLMQEKVAPRAAQIDEEGVFPWDVKELFAANGLFSLVVPPEYDGFDGKLLTLCVCIEEISGVCASSSMILGNQSLGASPIVLWGSLAQKKKYLPGVAAGEFLPCFALTEPDAGSDAAALKTRAVPAAGGYLINGSKRFITHASVGNPYTVFARLPVEGKEKISAFLVERQAPGVTIGKTEKKMGLRGSPTCEIFFENVFVPAENMLGAPGDGMRIALDCLDKGRVMVGAMAVGLAQGALNCALEYAKTRVQFGKPIIQHQAVGFLLADMETAIQAARSLVYHAAWRYDEKDPQMVRFSAMSKLFATDMVMEVTTNAVQVLGGYGYCRDYPVERMMRDAKIFAIFEGTNQIQRLVIARDLAG
ncbi:MAG: acyl-CoA dehydrogenase family protein [Desulfotomaculales bacterium]